LAGKTLKRSHAFFCLSYSLSVWYTGLFIYYLTNQLVEFFFCKMCLSYNFGWCLPSCTL
jgi:hypothetical protein